MPSKRRERELARQRHERRRQEVARRHARRRRRTAITAAVVAVLLVLGGAAYGISLLAGGNDKKKNQSTLASATPTPSVPGPPTKCEPIKPNPPKAGQPMIPPVSGTPPTTLVVKDVKKGTGPAAKNGSTVSVTYIGVSCSTGAVFDASYLHDNTAFDVSPLGTAGVIQGWNQGLIGVQAGGVRELVIPPALGYGATGSGSIKPNEVLIFLITAKSVKA